MYKAKRRVVMISGNYFDMSGIRLLKKQNQRLYFLYFADHNDPGFDLLPIMIEMDNYSPTNLRELQWVLDKVGFPDVSLSWLMIRYPYFDYSYNQTLKLKWFDLTFWVEAGKKLRYRYTFI